MSKHSYIYLFHEINLSDDIYLFSSTVTIFIIFMIKVSIVSTETIKHKNINAFYIKRKKKGNIFSPENTHTRAL